MNKNRLQPVDSAAMEIQQKIDEVQKYIATIRQQLMDLRKLTKTGRDWVDNRELMGKIRGT